MVAWHFYENTQRRWLVFTKLSREHFFHDYTTTSQVWPPKPKCCYSQEQCKDSFYTGCKRSSDFLWWNFKLTCLSASLHFLIYTRWGNLHFLLFLWIFLIKSFIWIWVSSGCVLSSLLSLNRWIFSTPWERNATFKFNAYFSARFQDSSSFLPVRLT